MTSKNDIGMMESLKEISLATFSDGPRWDEMHRAVGLKIKQDTL